MTVQSLINYLNNFNPNDEVEIEIYETISDKFIDSTFDIAISEKITPFPTLVIDIEEEQFKAQNYLFCFLICP